MDLRQPFRHLEEERGDPLRRGLATKQQQPQMRRAQAHRCQVTQPARQGYIALGQRVHHAPRIAPQHDISHRLGCEIVRVQRVEAEQVACHQELADLAATLKALHAMRGDPLDQSLRKGTQTEQNLVRSTDPVIQAFSGHEVRGAGPGNRPLWNRSGMVDYTSGFLGAAGMLMALYHRRRTGDGATVQVSLCGAGIYLLSEMLQSPGGRS